MRRAAALLVLLLVAGCGPRGPVAWQGYVEGEFVRVAAPFAGTLVRLDVQRGQSVAPGAPLFALEAENEEAGRREAVERARRAQAQVEDLKSGKRPSEIAAVQAQLAQAQAALAFSEKELARHQDLVSRGFESRQRLDEARSARDRDHNRVAELQADLATARLGFRAGEIRAAEAEAAAAREALAQADWRLRQKTVASTVGGIVADTLFVAGEWVPAGAPIVALLPPANVKVRFFVGEEVLGSLRLGQKVSIGCDGCGEHIAAPITFIAPQAEFTPPVIYSKDSRGKLVFLIEARPAPEDAARLHPGQPVDVTLP
ncbi:MAG: HlyD family secretion protein [Betaproteobacteria bacterium]